MAPCHSLKIGTNLPVFILLRRKRWDPDPVGVLSVVTLYRFRPLDPQGTQMWQVTHTCSDRWLGSGSPLSAKTLLLVSIARCSPSREHMLWTLVNQSVALAPGLHSALQTLRALSVGSLFVSHSGFNYWTMTSGPVAASQSIRHTLPVRVWWQNITRACHIYIYCVDVRMHLCGKSEEETILSPSHYVRSGTWTQVIGLGSNHLYLLSHAISPWVFIFNKISFITGIWGKFEKQRNLCLCVCTYAH